MDTVVRFQTAASYQEDAAGIRRPVPGDPRQVFAFVESVTRAEFYQAGRAGFSPSFVFTVFADDYHGEGTLEYNGEVFAVYRTYRKTGGDGSDYIELYAERKAGTDGAKSNA